MTPRQRITLQADWWPAACRAQGWKVTDRALRLRVCAWAVSLDNPTQLELLDAIASDRQPSRWLESTNDLDNGPDVDRVKACLGMLADQMKETGEVGQPQFGSGRRKRDVIRSSLKCLALFEAHPKRYLAALVQDMFASKHGPDITIKELTDDGGAGTGYGSSNPSDLQRLLMRLSQIVNDKRNANAFAPAYAHLASPEPLTIHEMKWEAGVACYCRDCAARRRNGLGPILPLISVEENWGDFDPELEAANMSDPELGNGDSTEGEHPF